MSDEGERPRSRRGRPTREEVAFIDRDVLAAARKCFITAGFDGTTMEAIAASAGVSKATIYLRYRDKKVLFEAVLQDRLEHWGRLSEQRSPRRAAKSDDRLRHFAHLMLRNSRDEEIRAFIKLVDGSFGWANGIGQEFRMMMHRPMIDLLVKEISHLCELEGRVARNPERAASIFMGMLSGYLHFNHLNRDLGYEAAEAFADHATDIFLMGRQSW